MKSVFLVIAVVLVGALGEDPLPPPDRNLPDLLWCFAPVFEDPDWSGTPDTAAFLVDLTRTAIDLRRQHQACEELPRGNIREENAYRACIASFNATFLRESTRLLLALHRLDPVMAQRVREHAPCCFEFDSERRLHATNRLGRVFGYTPDHC